MNASFYISDQKRNNHYEINFFYQGGINYIWLKNAGGELMHMEEQKFFDFIDKFFKENF